ncbi:MAG: site-2 protease family protein [Puniceicoccales bacterium]|jgi:Zn-dependent protease|nr:site-2 protease family protein [Puniceicoccales bacterium]
MDRHILQIAFIYYLWFLLGITIHEWGHAWSAHRLGDHTPETEGRLTLNPLAHISFIGTILVPLIVICFSPGFKIIGWGRPVNINVDNFRNRRLGDIICSLTGPLCNFILALLVMLIGFAIGRHNPSLEKLCIVGASVNVSLGLFNLIPIPPLDGSHILKIILGMREETYVIFSQVGIFILIIFINLLFFNHCFWIIHHYVMNGFWQISQLIFR